MLSSFTLVCYHVVTTFISFSIFSLYNYSPFFTWKFISSYANALGHLVCSTLIFYPYRVSSFRYIHLRFTCFTRMLDLWVYTYKPWGFIHNLFMWFMILWYKTYNCCMYAKIIDFDLCRQYHLNIYSRMNYVSMPKLGKGTRFWIHWTTVTFLFN